MSNTQSIAFTPEPEIAARLEKLCQITNLELDELLNALIYSPLKQIIEDGETGLLQAFIKPYRYLDKEDALAVIQNYERFVAELKASGDTYFNDDAKPARTSDGLWRVLFKSTHPDEQEGVTYR